MVASGAAFSVNSNNARPVLDALISSGDFIM
jgi:hypothetical protein